MNDWIQNSAEKTETIENEKKPAKVLHKQSLYSVCYVKLTKMECKWWTKFTLFLSFSLIHTFEQTYYEVENDFINQWIHNQLEEKHRSKKTKPNENNKEETKYSNDWATLVLDYLNILAQTPSTCCRCQQEHCDRGYLSNINWALHNVLHQQT